MFKWLQDKKNIAQKTAGMEEKKIAAERKRQVALSILDRRQGMNQRPESDRRHECLPITIERRNNFKLA